MHALLLLLAVAAVPEEFTWHRYNDGTDDYFLKRNGQLHGYYQPKTGLYKPFDADARAWGVACKPPLQPPMLNFGLLQTMRPKKDRFIMNGQEVSEGEAFGSLRDEPSPVVPDDATANRLVVIGKDDETQLVKTAWDNESCLTAWKGKVVFQTCRPDDWQIAGYGFHVQGSPVIYYLANDGTVLHRQDDFQGGAAALAEALRAADADYNPEKDADRREGSGSIFGRVVLSTQTAALLVAAFAVGVFIVLVRKGQ